MARAKLGEGELEAVQAQAVLEPETPTVSSSPDKPAPDKPALARYVIEPELHARTRHTCLQWAVSTALQGECAGDVVGRAQGYLDFILEPLSSELVFAYAERGAAPLH